MAVSLLAGCGSSSEAPAADEPAADEPAAEAPAEDAEAPAEDAEAPAADAGAGQVYYLNFKPEVDEVWQSLATQYTEETGVHVKVVT